MLSQRFAASLDRLIATADAWSPYPKAADRAGWLALPATLRARLIEAGETKLGYVWPFLPATDIMDYLRDGNRSRYEAPYMARREALALLVLAECAEGRGRFLDDIINGVWALCEESSWCLPAHLWESRTVGGLPDVHAPTVDLFAAETAALLAWTCYLVGPSLDAASTLVAARAREEVETRILTPALRRDFRWMALPPVTERPNNWNPWIISNWLTCTLLLEADPRRRHDGLAKAIHCLDRFIDPHPADGGYDEGPGYWSRAGASLFDCLELLHHASDGAVNVFGEPLVREIGRYIYRVQIADRWFVNFADAGARVVPPPQVIYGYGVRTGDADLQALGVWLAQHNGDIVRGVRGGGLGRALQAMFRFPIPAGAEGRPPLPRDVWMPVIELMAARDRDGSDKGFFVAAKGGHNAESHNHNDIGTFIVYRDGAPLLVDAGVGEYTRYTFSSQRYAIWTMQSAWHNLLPTIDGVMQPPGEQYAARDARWQADDAAAELSLELQQAYPPEAGLVQWRRTIRLERGHRVVIADDYELSRDTREIVLVLLTPSDVTLQGADTAVLTPRDLPDGLRSAGGLLRFAAPCLQVTAEIVPVQDTRLSPVWGDHLNRIVLRLTHPPMKGTLRTVVEA